MLCNLGPALFRRTSNDAGDAVGGGNHERRNALKSDGRVEILRERHAERGQRVAGGARDARTGPQSGGAGLAIAKRLAKADPANAQRQRDLSIARSNIDNARREQAG